MRALGRVAAADLRGRRLPTLLLLAVVAVATAGITAGLAQQRSAADRWDGAFADANGAHVALYGEPATLARVRRDREVVEASGPGPVTFATLTGGPDDVDGVEVRAAGGRRPAVGVPRLFGGRWLSGRDAREVVVERSFALDRGIEPGDRVRLRGERGLLAARVVGVALDLTDCFYPQCDSQLFWATDAAVRRLAGEEEAALLVRLADPEGVEAFEARAQDRYGTGVRDFEDWKDTRADALALNGFFAAFLASFGVFLLVAAGLVILGAVSARVLARYRELGILKAIGFTPRSLGALVLAENLAVAAAGVAVGIVVGGLLAPSLQLRMAEVLERGRATFPGAVLVTAALVVLAIVAAATLLPAVRAGRVPASQAIARGAAPLRTRSSRLARLAIRIRLGAPVAVGLKDAGARPLRTWLSVAALAVTVIAIVATLAFDRTVQQIADDPALGGDPQGIEVDPRDVPPRDVARAVEREPGVAAWFTATERQVAVGGETFEVRAIGGRLDRTGYVIREGRMLAGPGEVVIGYGLQQRLGLRVGERLRLRVGERPLDLRIVGRYAESQDSGERAMIAFGDLRRAEPAAAPGVFLARVRHDADRPRVARAIARAVPGVDVAVEEPELEDLDAFRAAFYVISALVLAVGLVNLLASTALGIRERIHDIAILKALGFTPRQVALSISVGTAAVAAAAVLVGVPAGLAAAELMLESVGSEAGIGPELGAAPAAIGVAAAAVGLVVLAAAAGALAARGVARAGVAEALRAE
jgi:putative ABC transport system permease protein